jgi:alpha-beta hydrolase superfamily lysophospholipase
VFEPPRASDERPVVVALHGRTGNLTDLRDRWAAAAARGFRTVIVQSSPMRAQDMHCWDDGATATRDVVDAVQATAGSGDDVVLCGFSQGGATAARVALTGDLPHARGFVAVAPGFLRGGLTAEDLAPLVPAASARGVRGWIAVGELDERYGPPAEEVAEALAGAGLRLDVLTVIGRGHEYPEPFAEVLDEAVMSVVGPGPARTSSISP